MSRRIRKISAAGSCSAMRKDGIMDKIWELFENLQELVYVVDYTEHNLVYMNCFARTAFGCPQTEDYRGRKCYELLQGFPVPCPFCNNEHLKPGIYYEWNYTNPLLKRPYALKDTLIEHEGRTYRLEMAIDITVQAEQEKEIQAFMENEAIVNECLRCTLAAEESGESLEHLLSYLGSKLESERAYIFEEIRAGRICNTYEWCAPGVPPEKANFQYATWDTVAQWLPVFEREQCVVVEDVEELKDINPQEYNWLKAQGTRSMVACPLFYKEKLIGYYGVDNPPRERVRHISTMLQVMGHFIVTVMKRRDMVRHLRYMSYHDQLTGVLNRYAMEELVSKQTVPRPLGLVYCDISGLKTINDSQGHAQGDQLILSASQLLAEHFPSGLVYRIGGDEFLALCFGDSEDGFREQVGQFQAQMQKSNANLAVGSVWAADGSLRIKELSQQAENEMYQSKRLYYSSQKQKPNPSCPGLCCAREEHQEHGEETPFQAFIRNNYYDAEAFFQSVAIPEAPYYLYFGDLQNNLYYISDNMRDDFGFPSNVVYDLIEKWGAMIGDPQDRILYQQDLRQVLEHKKDIHSLRYRITDRRGYSAWVHCRGIIKWSEDRTEPLFFSGCVSRLESNFAVDAATGFLRERAALNELVTLGAKNTRALVISFGLNHFTYINESRGRTEGDRILRDIANTLMEELGSMFTFYRLDGIRFMAISKRANGWAPGEAVGNIRGIINLVYSRERISTKRAASFGVQSFPQSERPPQEILENAITLINVAKLSSDLEYSEFSSDLIARQRERSNMAMTLSESVEKGCEGFRVVVQPIVSRESGAVIGGETLLRWKYMGQDISPAVFIPLLEETQMIKSVGKWVFEQAVRICSAVIPSRPDFLLSFNVSYLQVLDDTFLPFMEQTLAECGLPGRHLMLELTETHFDEMPKRLHDFVDQCHKMEIKFALDDFGNGFSSLQMLFKYPVNVIKLDRTLMNQITHSPENLDFIMSIVYACHRSGKQVCVEGVETEDELSAVRQTDCDMIQGFYFYRPIELEEFYRRLAPERTV